MRKKLLILCSTLLMISCASMEGKSCKTSDGDCKDKPKKECCE